MPICLVTGLADYEREKKREVRETIKEALALELSFDPNHVTVTCVYYDDSIDASEHVMIYLISKSFTDMSDLGRGDICSLITSVVEPIA